MTRSAAERVGDVRRLVAAAREVAGASALVPEIARSTGLSQEGVRLALAQHLETAPRDEDLAALVAKAGDTSQVTVILSANVFVGALRAIAIARAASPRVVVRPSRRDPVFARALVEAAADPAITIAEDVDLAAQTDGEIHVYGRDETIRRLRDAARPGVRVRGHGSGMGVAWVSAGADLAVAAAALARDVVAFDQRGCLSPRVALALGDGARALELGAALHHELTSEGERVPRGVIPADDRAAIGRYLDTMTYAGRVLAGADHAVAVANPGAPLLLAPPYRHVHVAPCASEPHASALLAPMSHAVVALGSDDLDGARAIAPAWARRSALGQMQRPPLDGPVDLRDDGA